MKTKPSVSLLLFSVAALAFVGMLSFSEYAFLCRMVILGCVAAIVAVKLVQVNEGKGNDAYSGAD